MKKMLKGVVALSFVLTLGSLASLNSAEAASSKMLEKRLMPKIIVAENVRNRITGINFTEKAVSLVPHEVVQLQPKLSPVGATNNSLTWWSSNSSIVTVTNEGQITGIRKGSTDIYASSKDGMVRDWMRVTVKDGYLMPTDITVTPVSATVEIGKPLTMSHKITPATTPFQYASWSSSDESIATVTQNGIISGVKPGKVTITATSAVASVKATSDITVKYGNNIPMTSISLAPKTKSIVVRETFQYKPIIEPSFATDKGINWYSDNHKVVTVAADGTVTGVGVGTTTIHAIAKDLGARDSVTITVRPGYLPITGIEVTPEKADLEVGKEITLTHKIIPEAVEYEYANWTSSNTAVATVSNRGVVKGLKAGNVTITATSANKKIKATSQIAVKYGSTIPVNSITISPTEKELIVKETYQFAQPVVKPDNATDKSLNWSSSNSAIISVDNTGKVTANKKGAVYIYAHSKDGKVRGQSLVRAKEGYLPITGIEITPAVATVEIGTDLVLKHTVTPRETLYHTADWLSSNDSVATVSRTGVVTGIKPGTVTITAVSNDPAIKATSQITVKYGATIPVNSIVLSPKAKELVVRETYQYKPEIKPDNATDKTLLWSSSNSNIAKVDSNGTVTAVKQGKADIYARSKDGKVHDWAEVSITDGFLPITGITVSPAVANLDVGSALSLSHQITPTDAQLQYAKWTSSDTSIATVDSRGTVTGIKPGIVTITGTSGDDHVSATSTITVKFGAAVPVSAIIITPYNPTMRVGAKLKLNPIIVPANATDKGLVWLTDDSRVLKVSTNGEVTSLRKGVADVIVTSKDGSVCDRIKITVN